MNKKVKNWMIFVVVLMSASLGWKELKAQGADWLPVKYVRIEGAFQYIAKDDIKQVLKGMINNGLYNLDLQQIKYAVKNLPWVESVRIKRVWPDAVDIKIKEQRPLVRWKEKGLLNKYAEKFEPENIVQFEYLPLLEGPIGNEKKLLEIMKGLALELNDQNMSLAEFKVNERRAWSIKLKKGLKLKLGRNEPFDNFHRFLNTFALLGKEQMARVEVVDLRYPNGYALTWMDGTEEIDWKKIAETNKNKVY